MFKILLMTGASSEIGQGILKEIKNDYDVILAHYNCSVKELQKLKEQWDGRSKLILLQADFLEEEGADKLVAQINTLGYKPNHIVHLPSVKVFNTKFHKCKWRDYEEGMNVSIHSIVRILQEYVPGMAKDKYGKIIFMLTSCVLNLPPRYQSPYVTIKYALLGLMKSLSVEYAGKGIMVNGVSPDMVETKFLSEIPQLLIQKKAMDSPLGRNLEVEDIIPTFKYLLSEAADAVTGQNLGITGGCN